jgi:hypothetical protein
MQALESEIDQQLLLAEKKAREEVNSKVHRGNEVIIDYFLILGARKAGQGERRFEGAAGVGNGRIAGQHRSFAENGENAEEGGPEEWQPGHAQGEARGIAEIIQSIHIRYLFFLQEIARENRTLKNNLSENHLEMTLIKAELAEIKSEYENKSLLMALDERSQPNAMEAEQIQRQLQLL